MFRNASGFSLGLCSLTLLAAILLAGCAKEQAPTTIATPQATSSPSPSMPTPMVAAAGGATVTGKVMFQGTAPVAKPIAMTKEASCHKEIQAKPIKDESAVVNPNKTLRYVVVYVKEGLKDQKFTPAAPVTIDQKTCWYRPHALAVMAGQTINVTNSDSGVLHNIHFMPKNNPPLNFGQPGPAPGGTVPMRSVVFQKPEIMKVKCDVHPWMHAVVAVLGNPYFAVTDEEGKFEIRGLPAGSYTLEAWHEKFGTQQTKVTVKGKEKKSVTLTFKG